MGREGLELKYYSQTLPQSTTRPLSADVCPRLLATGHPPPLCLLLWPPPRPRVREGTDALPAATLKGLRFRPGSAVSGGGTGRQPPPREEPEPQETTGNNSAIPQLGCTGTLAGQGRLGAPPNRNSNPQHSPSPAEYHRRPCPPLSHLSTPPAPPVWAHPSRAPDHPISPPQSQLQPRPRNLRGQGKDREDLAPSRPCTHRRASRRTTCRSTRCGLEGKRKGGDGEPGAWLRLKGAVTALPLSTPRGSCFKGRSLKNETQHDERSGVT